MAIAGQHRVDDGKIRSRIAKMNISPINHPSEFVRVIAHQDLTSVQVAVYESIPKCSGTSWSRPMAVTPGMTAPDVSRTTPAACCLMAV